MVTNVRTLGWKDGRSWLNDGLDTVSHHMGLWASVAGVLLVAAVAALLMISLVSMVVGINTVMAVQTIVHLASGPLALAVWMLILRSKAPTAHVTWTDWRHSLLASIWWMVPVLAIGVWQYAANDAMAWQNEPLVGAIALVVMLAYGVATMFVPAILLESHRTTPMLSVRPWIESAQLVAQSWRPVVALFAMWAVVLIATIAVMTLIGFGVGYALGFMHLLAYGATADLVMQLLMAMVFFMLGLAFNVSVAAGYHVLRPAPAV